MDAWFDVSAMVMSILIGTPTKSLVMTVAFSKASFTYRHATLKNVLNAAAN
jgi:hypothetical protein